MVIQIGEENLDEVAAVHAEAFSRQKNSLLWVKATSAAFPRSLCFCLKNDGAVIGYIFWMQKSGIRPEAVLELEQIAVVKKHRGKGHAAALIRESLAQARKILAANNQSVKTVLVSTRIDNAAQKLYASVLGAKVEATVSNLYSADEVFMVAHVGT